MSNSFLRRATIAAVLGILAAAFAAPAAHADFGITKFGGSLTSGGSFSRQAGEHADLTTLIRFPSKAGNSSQLDASVRNVKVDLPPGLIGNPTAAPTCSAVELVAGLNGFHDMCPTASQVGIATIYFGDANNEEGSTVGVFNLERPDDLPGLFGFNISGSIIRIEPRIRPGDFGASATVRNASQALKIFGSKVTLWGVPADPSHDADRFIPNFLEESRGTSTLTPLRPLMTNPTSCGTEPLLTSLTAESWEQPGVLHHASFDSDLDGTPFRFEGCDRLAFKPAVQVRPQTRVAGQPTGLDFELKIPQNEDPGGLATAQMRKSVLTLPQGVAISPSAAAGQGACSLAQIGLDSEALPSCPDSAKIGTLSVRSPLLEDPLQGEVILAKQYDNPFGSLLAIYLVIRGPGTVIKLPGKIEADPQTGQLTTTFDNTPQLPFEELSLSLRGGPQAALVAPSDCGTFNSRVEMTTWSSSVPYVLDSPMSITEGCDAGGFDPKLRAGTGNPIAGDSSPFTLQVTRQDGEQNIARLDATLPEGLLAKLAGVALCGDAAAATGNCPAASQVGTVTVGAGAGSNPIYVPQPGKSPTAVYLAGPYKGAPYSLVVKVPAQAGPFDLGTVTVRNALHVDPVTTQVTASSDPLPQILQGIPIAYRDVRVEVSRPDFTLNPTSCDPMKVESTIFSTGGKSASPSARFQVTGCSDLGFKPKLALSLSGPTHRSAHPKLRAVLTARKGDANIGRAQVTLPKTEFLENAHIQTICTRVQYAAKACPAKSVYGYAKAWSPLLDKPLSGPVYLRSSNHELPDLVASLEGQIHVDLQGRIDSVKARIRNTFDFVPDAPVSKFVLTMQGGKKGLLVNNTELCRATPRAEARFDGQNGKTSDSDPVVKVECGTKGRGGKRK